LMRRCLQQRSDRLVEPLGPLGHLHRLTQ
jgi:hypothetical protein